MKAVYLILKYLGVALICYILVQLELRLYGVAIFKLFPHDAHKWFDLDNPPLILTLMRIALIIGILPLGWLNVSLAHKIFKSFPKATWLMTVITVILWIMWAGLFWLLNIPSYSWGICAALLASMAGAMITAFRFRKENRSAQ